MAGSEQAVSVAPATLVNSWTTDGNPAQATDRACVDVHRHMPLLLEMRIQRGQKRRPGTLSDKVAVGDFSRSFLGIVIAICSNT
jgi:hypothetical protein